ncbi:hypothetical protein D3C79_616700 [compost metagenome]
MRVTRGWLEQAIEAVDAFDQQLAIVRVPHTQAFAGTEYRITPGNVAHVDDPRLFVGEQQALAAFRMRFDGDEDFVVDAPASAKQAVAAFIPAVVVALPVQRDQSGQAEIEFGFAAQQFGACGAVDRVG